LAGVGVILPEQTAAATTTNSRGEVVTDSALLIFKLSERLRHKATLHRCAKAEESGAEEEEGGWLRSWRGRV